ncbi:MAG: YbhB/YbcL family Raf kinase inhibitor-like protein [Myxococcota bacterium]
MAAASVTADVGALELRSSAFEPGGEIPRRYTCEGRDVSPPLAWTEAPEGARSYALIVEDPDVPDPRAPRRRWVHWVVYDLPAGTHELSEGAGVGELPAGARPGRNDWGRLDYGGPCPPIGRHRYFHTLYALDTRLDPLPEPTKAELEKAMKGHVLERSELIGTYQKQKP